MVEQEKSCCGRTGGFDLYEGMEGLRRRVLTDE